MTEDDQTALRSPEMRVSLRLYAKRLQHLFSRLGRLSGTGVEISRASHGQMTLHESSLATRFQKPVDDPAAAVSANSPASSNARAGKGIPAPISEVELLKLYAELPSTPRLLLAPFGAGKSVVLETIACALADRLLDEDLQAGQGAFPLVPLPVRLRSWNWHQGETFSEFLLRSQCVFDGYDDWGVLTASQLDLLKKSGCLFVLLDGYDELPTDYDSRDGRSPREAALTAMRLLANPLIGCPCQLLISTRPGTGIEHDPLFEERSVFQLHEFEFSAILALVRRQLNLDESDVTSAPIRALLKADEYVKDVLSRPLFIATWCSEWMLNGDVPHRGHTGLMESLLLKSFDVRRIGHWLSQSTAQRERFRDHGFDRDAIFRLAPHLGALIFVFAEGQFPSRVPTIEVGRRVRQLLPKANDDEVAWLRFLLERAGLVVQIGENALSAWKIPIAEFLVGQYLVGVAENESHGEQQFIDIFRRWVWLPELHDVLVFAFDALRFRSVPQATFASGCTEWLLNVGDDCPLTRDRDSRVDDTIPPASDDLVTPLSLLALRLGANEQRAVRGIVSAESRAGRYSFEAAPSIIDHVPVRYLKVVVEGLLAEVGRAEHFFYSNHLYSVLEKALSRIVGEDAEGAIELLVASVKDAEESIDHWVNCVDRIQDVTGRIPGAERRRCADKWLTRIRKEPSDDIRHLLAVAANWVVDRICKDEAPGARIWQADGVSGGAYADSASLISAKLRDAKSSTAISLAPPKAIPAVHVPLIIRSAEQVVELVQQTLTRFYSAASKNDRGIVAASLVEVVGFGPLPGADAIAPLLMQAMIDPRSSGVESQLYQAFEVAVAHVSVDTFAELIDIWRNQSQPQSNLWLQLQSITLLAKGMGSQMALTIAGELITLLQTAVPHPRTHLMDQGKNPQRICRTGKLGSTNIYEMSAFTQLTESSRQLYLGAARAVSRQLQAEEALTFASTLGEKGDCVGIVRLATEHPGFTAIITQYDSASGFWRCTMRQRSDGLLILGGKSAGLAPPRIRAVLSEGIDDGVLNSPSVEMRSAEVDDRGFRKPKQADVLAQLRDAIQKLLEQYPEGLSARSISEQSAISKIRVYDDPSALNKLRAEHWPEFSIAGAGRNQVWVLKSRRTDQSR